jgi:uncharacterized RDD family membrane protein YckC
MTDQPPPPPPGNYPPPPPGGGYPPPPPPGGYPPPQQGGYPPPPQQGGYPPPPQQGGYPPPPPQGAPGYPPPPPPPAPALAKEAYTPWFTRVLAWLIDSIPPIILIGIAMGIAVATGENVCYDYGYGYGGGCTSTWSGIGVTLVALAYIVSLAYVVWNYGYRQGTTGSSIGKGIMKFKVVSEKTWQPIGFGMSIVRQLAHIVDGLVCYIGYLWPLWDDKRQTFADKIMTTVCVPLNPQPLPPGPQQLNPQPLPPRQ